MHNFYLGRPRPCTSQNISTTRVGYTDFVVYVHWKGGVMVILCLIVQNLKTIIYSIHMPHYEIKTNINKIFSWEFLEKAIFYTAAGTLVIIVTNFSIK